MRQRRGSTLTPRQVTQAHGSIDGSERSRSGRYSSAMVDWRGKSPVFLEGQLLTRTVPRKGGLVTGLGQPRGRSVAVDLQTGDAQTGNPVGFDGALPGEEFLD